MFLAVNSEIYTIYFKFKVFGTTKSSKWGQKLNHNLKLHNYYECFLDFMPYKLASHQLSSVTLSLKVIQFKGHYELLSHIALEGHIAF